MKITLRERTINWLPVILILIIVGLLVNECQADILYNVNASIVYVNE